MGDAISTRVVAIHGFLGQPQDWQGVKEKLGKLTSNVDFQAVDLFSKLPNVKEKSAADWAKRFNNLQKNRHVERNILMGYSLGGRLALQAAYDKPGLWDEIILISAHPGLQAEQEKSARKQSDLAWAEKFLNLPWQEVIKLWNDQPVFIQSKKPSRRDTEMSRDALAAALVNWSLADHDFVEELLVPLKPKLHWFAGEFDKKYRSLFDDLKSRGYVEDINVIKSAGHRVIFDNPEELARQLVQKLQLV